MIQVFYDTCCALSFVVGLSAGVLFWYWVLK